MAKIEGPHRTTTRCSLDAVFMPFPCKCMTMQCACGVFLELIVSKTCTKHRTREGFAQ